MDFVSKKRGLSTIVATLLIILLVLVATGIIWIIIRNVVKSGSEQISLGKFTLDLEIEKVQILGEDDLGVTIKRNPGEGEFVGLVLVADDGKNSEEFRENVSLNELEKRTLILTPNTTNPENITKITLSPIFKLESGKEIVGGIIDVWEKSSFGISSGTCVDTCTSLGYECGIQIICGTSVDCGGCGTGYVCSGTTCVLESNCTDSCISLGYDCGYHTICGTNTSCGTCSTGYSCNSTGQCAVICTDTCSSLEYECGTQIICGASVNCGSCSTGYVCLSGVCTSVTYQGACGTLSTSGAIYVLNSDVSSTGTCFSITAPNITLDCQGHSIIYSTGGAIETYGVYSNKDNIVIRNCDIIDGNWTNPGAARYAIFFDTNDDSTIYNNFISTSSSVAIRLFSGSDFNNLISNTITSVSSHGIYLRGSSYNNLVDNKITSNSGYGIQLFLESNNNNLINNSAACLGPNEGIYLYSSSGNNLINNLATSNSGYGIHLYNSPDNIFTNNMGTSNSGIGIWISSSPRNIFNDNTFTSGAYDAILVQSSDNNIFTRQTAVISGGNGTTYGVYIYGTNNTLFRDCVNINGGTADVFVGQSTNTTLINCPYNTESVDRGELIRKWYYQASVYNEFNNSILGASVSAFNNLDALQFTALTDSSGKISKQEIIDYIDTGGTKNYYSIYTVNATKTGYTTSSNRFNLTGNKLDDIFILYSS